MIEMAYLRVRHLSLQDYIGAIIITRVQMALAIVWM